MESIIFGFIFGSSFKWAQQHVRKPPEEDGYIVIKYEKGGPFGISPCAEVGGDRVLICQCPPNGVAGLHGVKPGSELVWYGPINIRMSNLGAMEVRNILANATQDVELKFHYDPELIKNATYKKTDNTCEFWEDVVQSVSKRAP